MELSLYIHTFEFMYAEVITSAEFHPTHCNMLAYSSSRGSIRLVDMRQSALCDSHSKL
jgi:serine/threonine-protein phosphatase 2A regulatory subunit B